jgi:hypothetical protein
MVVFVGGCFFLKKHSDAPARAAPPLGQLELVTVVEGGRGHPRHVRTGKRFGDDVEVLAGVEPGERVLLGGRP